MYANTLAIALLLTTVCSVCIALMVTAGLSALAHYEPLEGDERD